MRWLRRLVGTFHGAVGFAVQHKAQIHPAHDAAGGFLLGGQVALVGAAYHHSADGIARAQQGAAVLKGVVLGVEQVFHSHGTGDAAHIHVGLDLTPVDTVFNAALVAVLPGGGIILEVGFAARLADLFHSVQQQAEHYVDLIVDGTHFTGQLAAGALYTAVQGIHLVRHALYGIEQGVGGILQLRAGARHVDGILVAQPAHDVAGLVQHIGHSPGTFLQLINGRGELLGGAADEVAGGLELRNRILHRAGSDF